MSEFQVPFQDLILVPQDHRDSLWEERFLKELLAQNVKVLRPEPQTGPDGWPYLFVESGEGADERVVSIVDWLSTRGIGLVLNPAKIAPDYVLSYGMIWNFRERGSFLSPAAARKSGEFRLADGQEVLTGTPSEGFLPKYARSILRQFLLDQGAMAPKILLVSEDRENFDLCFSVESLGQPPQREHAGIAEALAWFLPAHYSVSLMSEKVVSGFEPL